MQRLNTSIQSPGPRLDKENPMKGSFQHKNFCIQSHINLAAIRVRTTLVLDKKATRRTREDTIITFTENHWWTMIKGKKSLLCSTPHTRSSSWTSKRSFPNQPTESLIGRITGILANSVGITSIIATIQNNVLARERLSNASFGWAS